MDAPKMPDAPPPPSLFGDQQKAKPQKKPGLPGASDTVAGMAPGAEQLGQKTLIGQ
jgi:hypothetical protein